MQQLQSGHRAARIGILLVANLVLASMSPVASAEPAEEFGKLETQLEIAVQAYGKAVAELAEKNPNFDPKDKSKLPPDPRPAIVDKMEALAATQLKAPDGFDMLAATLYWSIEIEAPRAPARFATMVDHFPEREQLLDVLGSLEYAYTYAGKPDEWTAAADMLASKTKDKRIRTGARFLTARIKMNANKLDEAKAVFGAIVKDDPKSEAAKRATRAVFEIEHLQIGMVAPDFEATTLDGKKVTIKSLRGKVVLLDFWATWCPGCVAEIPSLKKASARFKDDFVILGISADDERSALIGLVKAMEMPGVQTWDMKEGEYPVLDLFNVQGLPTWLVLDKDGIIRARDPFGKKLVPAIEAAMKPYKPAEPKKN